MLNKFKNLIEESKTIIIFRHLIGDGDALGSQWALYYYLKNKYPNKEVYAVGDANSGYEKIFSQPHQISDEKFHEALAIVLDTANTERISDQRYKFCKNIVKIDHHLDVDSYGDIEFVYPEVTSASEILTNILRNLENNKALDNLVAQNLYTGIISDTQDFSVAGVNSKTFSTAAYLSESNLDVAKINRLLNEVDIDTYKFKSFLSNQIIFDEKGLAYVKILNSYLKKYNISHPEAKRQVNIMKNIEGINIWALFIEQKDKSNVFDASLRSSQVVISDVAQKFGGGGHKFACGVKNLTTNNLNDLLENLKMNLLG